MAVAAPLVAAAVVYQTYIRSFADGDGIGDLAGIRSRLSYTQSRRVCRMDHTVLSLAEADGGYDVADYRDIGPLFGALDDADALITEAHAVGCGS